MSYFRDMKKITSYFCELYLRYLWRKYFNLFLRQGKTLFEAIDGATGAVNAVVHCHGLDEDVLPYVPLLLRLSAPRERKCEEAQPE